MIQNWTCGRREGGGSGRNQNVVFVFAGFLHILLLYMYLLHTEMKHNMMAVLGGGGVEMGGEGEGWEGPPGISRIFSSRKPWGDPHAPVSILGLSRDGTKWLCAVV